MRVIERERKFDIARGRRVPDLGPRVVLGPRRRMLLTAVYLDTPDLLLTRNKVTLRRRTGGPDAGWHLKLPRPDGARLEIHAPLSAGPMPSRVPVDLRKQVKSIIGLAPLVPVAVLRTVRTVRELRGTRGRVFAILCDDTVSVSPYAGARVGAGPGAGPGAVPGAGPGVADRQVWRELEIELVHGTSPDRAMLEDLTQRLAAAGVPVSGSASKIGRFLADRVAAVEAALATADPVAPADPAAPVEHAEIPSPPAEPSAGQVVLTYLAAQVGVLQGRERDVVRDAPDAVHKSRVAVRRMRSALRTARPLFDPEAIEPLRLELSWWGEVLGGPRDAEVIRDRLVGAAKRLPRDQLVGPVVARLEHELFRGHAAAHRKVVAALRSRRYTALSTALTDLLVAPALTPRAQAPATEQLPGLLRKAARRVDKRKAFADTAPAEDRAYWLHETRKKAKAARYLAESVAVVYGQDATTLAALFEAVTESLGEVQDTVVAVARLREVRAVAQRHREPTTSYDILVALEEDSGRQAAVRGAAALAAIAAPDVRAWFARPGTAAATTTEAGVGGAAQPG